MTVITTTKASVAGVSFSVDWDAPVAVEAGSATRIAIELRADAPLAAGTLLAFARRWPSDWGLPQWAQPDAPDYLRVSAGTGVAVHLSNARLHLFHPFDHVTLIELLDRVAADTVIRIAFGEGVEGGPGLTAQTFIEEASPLSIRLSVAPRPEFPTGAGGSPSTLASREFVEVARPTIRVVGTDAHRLVLTVPSCGRRGEAVSAHLRVEDRWGNPARLDHPVVVSGVDSALKLPPSGWCRFEVRFAEAGVHRLHARVDALADFATTSNPIRIEDGVSARAGPSTAEKVGTAPMLVWGDPHAQSVIGCGARTIDAYFRHARDFAATDFSSHQANCFLVSGEEWVETERVTARMNEDARFVALLGVEWSAASHLGGDHNLYFPGDGAELRRCSHEFVADKSDLDSDLRHVDDLHAHYRGSDTLIALHVGGRTADLRFHEPSLDRLLEVHSTHATSEWFLLDALRRGYRMGVTAGSDGVDGRPGASHPGHMAVRNLRGGLTAVETAGLHRGAIYEALKARRCYATTGERILLSFRAGDWRMGEEVVFDRANGAALPRFEVRVEGTAPIAAVDFYRDDRMMATRDLLSEAGPLSDRIRVSWQGASAQGNWQRARMQWDGSLRIDGARIVDAIPWAFDSPDETLTPNGDNGVAWRSVTAGDPDGVILALEGLDSPGGRDSPVGRESPEHGNRPDPFAQASLSFSSSPLSVHCPLGSIGSSGWAFELQDPWRRLELRRLPLADPPLGVAFEFEDQEPTTGAHAYWVRVRQLDGAVAWSSPIFVLPAQG